MDVEITYTAKDGRRFDDPLKCEDYEKHLGVIPDSVADIILELEKQDPKAYIFGIVMVRRKDGTATIYTRFTGCCDSVLEDYVNIINISEEQRYICATFKELIAALRNEVQDAAAQYMIVFSKDVEFGHPGIMANHNPLVWKH